jgi:hypothetical protein
VRIGKRSKYVNKLLLICAQGAHYLIQAVVRDTYRDHATGEVWRPSKHHREQIVERVQRGIYERGISISDLSAVRWAINEVTDQHQTNGRRKCELTLFYYLATNSCNVGKQQKVAWFAAINPELHIPPDLAWKTIRVT